jgi:hypothetical protein
MSQGFDSLRLSIFVAALCIGLIFPLSYGIPKESELENDSNNDELKVNLIGNDT